LMFLHRFFFRDRTFIGQAYWDWSRAQFKATARHTAE
jgi:hypothetical protein